LAAVQGGSPLGGMVSGQHGEGEEQRPPR
jgi:hypothetical protein